jgi:hypothetical protein
MPKRSAVLKKIESILSSHQSGPHLAETVKRPAEELLFFIEQVMEPKLRPLTDKEVEDHVLVKQVHHSKKDEVRNYVRNLDYEYKREWISEEE